MPESYYPDYSDHSDEQLDELLCEYVDGTMDPSVRVAFEEYLAVNPELANHARCLCQTRTMLCSYGCRHPNEESLQDQIKRRVAGELFRQDRTEAVFVQRLGHAAMLTSSVSLVVILGMMVGLTAVRKASVTSDDDLGGNNSVKSMMMPSDAYGQPASALPMEWNKDLIKWSLMGPSRMLPEIDLVPIGWRAASVDSLQGSGFQFLSIP
jgi:hypothetical protein